MEIVYALAVITGMFIICLFLAMKLVNDALRSQEEIRTIYDEMLSENKTKKENL